jgi:hypothetical protein
MTEWLSRIWCSILCILQTSWWYNAEDHTLQWGFCWEIHLVTELVNFYLLLIFCMNEVHMLCLMRSERMWGNTVMYVFVFCSEDWQFCIWCEHRPRQLAAFTGENKLCVCACVHVWLARMESLFLKFFWESVNVENEVKWRVFNTLYIKFQNCN